MNCTKCSSDTQVLDSRVSDESNIVRRRRSCLACNHRFTTYEVTAYTFEHYKQRDDLDSKLKKILKK
jgi:transcriptional regulator NrdR family protein